MTLDEVQELQRRLTAAGFDTDGSDGRVGRDTQPAVHGAGGWLRRAQGAREVARQGA